MALAGDPMHPLRPHRDAAFLAGVALEQRQIELAAFEIALEIHALVGAHVEPQARMRARERRQQLGQPIGGEILGDAEPDRAFDVRAAPARRALLRRATTAAAHRTAAARRPRSASRPCRCGSSSGWPTSSSSRLICWLTVDCVRWTRSPARVKPPASTTETKLRNSSRSSIGASIRKSTDMQFII